MTPEQERQLWADFPKPEMPDDLSDGEQIAYLRGCIDGRQVEQRWQAMLAERQSQPRQLVHEAVA